MKEKNRAFITILEDVKNRCYTIEFNTDILTELQLPFVIGLNTIFFHLKCNLLRKVPSTKANSKHKRTSQSKLILLLLLRRTVRPL